MLKFQQKENFLKIFLNILKKCPLFEGICDESLLKMLVCLGVRVVSFEKKYTVFAEGTEAKYIGIVLSGKVQIMQVDYYGNRSLLGTSEPGEMFAEAFAASGTRSLPISAVAAEDSEIMLVDCSHILHTCQSCCSHHQMLIYNLMKALATKNLQLHQRIEITSRRTTREKLMAYLTLMAKRTGNDCFEIPFNRQELADYLEVERSGLSAEISKLRNEGIIESRRNRFELLQKY